MFDSEWEYSDYIFSFHWWEFSYIRTLDELTISNHHIIDTSTVWEKFCRIFSHFFRKRYPIYFFLWVSYWEPIDEFFSSFFSCFITIEAYIDLREGGKVWYPPLLERSNSSRWGHSDDSLLTEYHLIEFSLTYHYIIVIIFEVFSSVEHSLTPSWIEHIFVSFRSKWITSEFKKCELSPNITDRYSDPVCSIKWSISELSFWDDLIIYPSFMEVFSYIFRECFLTLCYVFFRDNYLLFYRFCIARFYWRIVSPQRIFSWVVSEMLQEGDPVSLFETFLALIASCCAVDIEMCLFPVTVFIAVIEYAVSDDFFTGAIVINSLFWEITLDSCSRNHNSNFG